LICVYTLGWVSEMRLGSEFKKGRVDYRRGDVRLISVRIGKKK